MVTRVSREKTSSRATAKSRKPRLKRIRAFIKRLSSVVVENIVFFGDNFAELLFPPSRRREIRVRSLTRGFSRKFLYLTTRSPSRRLNDALMLVRRSFSPFLLMPFFADFLARAMDESSTNVSLIIFPNWNFPPSLRKLCKNKRERRRAHFHHTTRC